MQKHRAGLFLFCSLGFPQDPDFHLYLAFGQSNREGFAPIEVWNPVHWIHCSGAIGSILPGGLDPGFEGKTKSR